MFKNTLCRSGAALAIALALTTGAAAADLLPGVGLEQPRPPKPTFTVSTTTPLSGGTFDVVAEFALDDTVHLYRDKLDIKWTTLLGAEFKEFVFPPAKKVPDALAETPGQTIAVFEGSVKIIARMTVTAREGEAIRISGKLAHQSCTDDTCFPPEEEPFQFSLTAGEGGGSRSLLGWILIGFLTGIGLSLTPCVYPMIPVTAAVIGARREGGFFSALAASLVYVLGLSIVYAVIGLLVAVPGSGARSFLASAYVLVPVSLLFVALAVVMLAGLNFAAPTGFTAKLQGMLAGKKGMATTFALGAVSGLVAGPCIAAPLAAVLVKIAQTGDTMLGFWTLFALAWGMGVPLILFGTATGLMPKAGAWMEWIKKLLGFVLLWAAVYFVASIIGRTAYEILFALILIVGAVYLGGLDALTRESTFFERLQKVVGVVALIYAAVLVFSAMGPRRVETGPSAAETPGAAQSIFRPGTQAAVDEAIAQGRPVALDFTADFCGICKVLDRNLFTKPEAAKAAEGISCFKIDFDKEKELVKRYAIFGPPAVVLVAPGGKVTGKLKYDESTPLDEFLEDLKKLKP